jgi:hypothetical protein
MLVHLHEGLLHQYRDTKRVRRKREHSWHGIKPDKIFTECFNGLLELRKGREEGRDKGKKISK